MPKEKYDAVIKLLSEVAEEYPMDPTYGTSKKGNPEHYWGMTPLESLVRQCAKQVKDINKPDAYIHPGYRREDETIEQWRERWHQNKEGFTKVMPHARTGI